MGRAHGACEARSRREAEAMWGIGDAQLQHKLAATPMRPPGSGGAPASAALPLLANVPHCLRRGRLALCPARRSELRPMLCSDRLLGESGGFSRSRRRVESDCGRC